MAISAHNTSAPARQAPTPVVFVSEGQAFASSRDVASYFGKRHDNVLRSVDRLIAEEASLRALNFEETFTEIALPNGGSRRDRSFNMNRDGFALLAMGFTGEKALRFKLAWIKAFNRMEAELRAIAAPKQAALPRPRKPKRQPDAPPHLIIDRENVAIMRVGGQTLLVDLARLEFSPDERVVCFDAAGELTVGPVSMAWPHQNWNGRRFGHLRADQDGAHRGVWIIGGVLATLSEPLRPRRNRAKRDDLALMRTASQLARPAIAQGGRALH